MGRPVVDEELAGMADLAAELTTGPIAAKPYYEDDAVTIYHADCRELLPLIGDVDLVLTDPPYGIALNTKLARATRNGRRASGGGHDWEPIEGDAVPFDPSPLLAVSGRLILWGANHYAAALPPSKGWLVWNKRDMGKPGMHSDAELAWTNWLNVTRCHNQFWQGPYRTGEVPTFLHPAQKPINLMRWCMELAPDADLILDPFMGTGTTLRAAKDLGRRAIGIEIEEKYCEIAAKRMEQATLPLPPSNGHHEAESPAFEGLAKDGNP